MVFLYFYSTTSIHISAKHGQLIPTFYIIIRIVSLPLEVRYQCMVHGATVNFRFSWQTFNLNIYLPHLLKEDSSPCIPLRYNLYVQKGLAQGDPISKVCHRLGSLVFHNTRDLILQR